MHQLNKEVGEFLPTSLKQYFEYALSVQRILWPIISNSAISSPDLPFTQNTVQVAINSVIAISPNVSSPHGANWLDRAGPMEHFRITAFIAGELAKQWQENEYLAEVLGWYHDLGRCITHQFYLTDLFTIKILSVIGANPIIFKNLHSIDWFLHSEQPVITASQLTKLQIISLVSDLLSKRSSTSPYQLRRPDSLITDIRSNRLKYAKEDVDDLLSVIDTEHEEQLIHEIFLRLELDGINNNVLERILRAAESKFLT